MATRAPAVLKTRSGEIMLSILAHNRRRGWHHFEKLIFDILSPSKRLKSRESFDNFGTVRVIISKVGGKLWRKEGYIPSWRFDQTSYILFIKLLTFHPQYCTWTATIKQDLGDSSPNRPTFTLVVIKIYQKVRTGVYDCSRRYEISYVLHGVRLF